MKKIVVSFVLLLALVPMIGMAGDVSVLKPTAKRPTSFAVVIDRTTYDKTREVVLDYRDALEQDGLATYILISEWKNPEHVRSELQKLYRKAHNLEGVVLVGDIPVAMVRNAQHMTTAFKMDEQKYSWDNSSVASDRFYDDLHLKFDFLRQDSLNSRHFYYELSHDSPQQLDPTFYSGRILYPEALGGDRYAAIAAFLRKAAREKRQAQQLDHVTTFAGHFYNSDDLTVWIDEQVALRENFPLTVREANGQRRLNFRMDDYMKFRLFDELARVQTDLMIFNEHGSIDMQYISGLPPVDNYEKRLKAIRDDIYGSVRSEERKKDGDLSGAKAYFTEKYALSPSFFDAYDPSAVDRTDSMHRANEIISLEDLKGLRTQPRMVVFNACYNGSFHHAGNIASYYLFNDGRTVATQGNTVNILQDRWTYEMIGLLSHGVRVGQWNRLIATLEGHIIGDPTARYAPIQPGTLAADMVVCHRDIAYWRRLLASPYADVASLSLRMLADAGAIRSDELLSFMQACPMATTRMECLKLLSRHRNADFNRAIMLGLYDSYELLRRNAAVYAWQSGDPSLLVPVADVYVNYPESQRVNFILDKSLSLFPSERVTQVVDSLIAVSTYPDRKAMQAMLDAHIKHVSNNKTKELVTMMDPQATETRRISAIRSVRNNTYHQFVPRYLELLADHSQPERVRVAMAEALGWFVRSAERERIVEGCRKILSSHGTPPALAAELRQTILRLQ